VAILINNYNFKSINYERQFILHYYILTILYIYITKVLQLLLEDIVIFYRVFSFLLSIYNYYI
jgi:hypothetical protein